MKLTKMLKKLMVLAIVAIVSISLVGCDNTPKDEGYTYRTYTAISPSNWNELTYQDNNDTQIMSYIGDSFFQYDFKFDENGKIVDGEFEMQYAAATALADISAQFVGDERYNITEGETGRAYKITLRDDLKWDDGTPITAEDFVYTMQEQLNPLFQNYRADSFYNGATVIYNAKGYAKQGQKAFSPAVDVLGDNITSFDGLYFDATNVAAFAYIFDTTDMTALEGYESYFQVDGEDLYTELVQYAGEKRVPMTKELSDKLAKLFSDNAPLKPYWGWVDTEIGYFAVTEYTWPEVAWDQVGMWSEGNSIILVLEKALPLLKEDGSLSYQAAYNMSSLPLVKKDLYEKCKIAPAVEGGLWTSNYNSSVETTASWGPYKLESFQTGKEYVIVRNENWYGYSLPQYEGQFQTDKIVCETIAEWNTAWIKFLAGEIDGIGIDPSIAADYKNSERAYFTPDDFVASLQLQSDVAQLKAREVAGEDKEILGNVKFRKALSLAIDRADFAAQTTTSSLKGFGLFNSMHYYDVENGGVYRNSDEAKKVLCEVYGVEYTDATLDAAVESLTGYDLELARKLVTEAYEEELAKGTISATDKVRLTGGSGAINETVTKRFNYIFEAWTKLMEGTPLEGRIVFDDVKDFSDKWATDFRAGAYDVCMGGWSGAAWDPGYFLLAYLSPDYMYSTAWDTSAQQLTFTMKGVAEDGGDITETMSLLDWYDCLNGATGAKHDFSANALPQEKRLQLIAALEKEVLQVYYSVPLYNSFAASLISYKVDYVTYTYNTFMGYGGMRYMTYNYNNSEWAKVVKDNNGELNYK